MRSKNFDPSLKSAISNLGMGDNSDFAAVDAAFGGGVDGYFEALAVEFGGSVTEVSSDDEDESGPPAVYGGSPGGHDSGH